MRFAIPSLMLAKLRSVCTRCALDDDERVDGGEAFVLDEGLGPVAYLTADGRVLLDGSGWDASAGAAVREASDDEAACYLVVGAKKTGVSELLELLPPRPRRARTCGGCEGRRWIALAGAAAGEGAAQIVCGDCHGRGWTR